MDIEQTLDDNDFIELNEFIRAHKDDYKKDEDYEPSALDRE